MRTYVNQKLSAASALGHDLVVIAPGPEDGEEDRLGGRVIWVAGPPLPVDPRYFVLYRERRVHELIARERPDVIEGSSPWTAGWFAARYRGPGAKALVYHQDPVAVYPHTFFDRRVSPDSLDKVFTPYWHYVRRLASRFDATIVAGRWLAERLRGFGIARAEAVPFGIEREQFSPDAASREIRRELLQYCGVPEDAALLVAISRYHPEKRVPTLIRAFERVASRRKAGFVIFGDGPFRRKIEREAAHVPGVHLTGYVDDRGYIASALASADLFVHGSAAETYGFVVAEAMCAGTPVVVPDRGGAFDLAQPGFSEVYVPGDAADCAAAIERLLGRDRSTLRKSALEAADRDVWSVRQHFEALFECYSRLVRRTT